MAVYRASNVKLIMRDSGKGDVISEKLDALVEAFNRIGGGGLFLQGAIIGLWTFPRGVSGSSADSERFISLTILGCCVNVELTEEETRMLCKLDPTSEGDMVILDLWLYKRLWVRGGMGVRRQVVEELIDGVDT